MKQPTEAEIAVVVFGTVLDEFRCNKCGECHELCFCDYDNLPSEALPCPGTDSWERMVDYMRDDLDSDMGLTKLEMVARKLLKEQGRDFDTEFKKWKEKNNNI